jgi:hypothetical protein
MKRCENRALSMSSDAQCRCRLSQESATCQWRGAPEAWLIVSALTKEVVCDEITDDVLIIQGAVWEDT